MDLPFLDRLKKLDAERPSLPGEHWLTFAAGLWLLTRVGRSGLGRTAAVLAGAGLLYRAASGRDGLVKALR
jgi:uncharacterized membrane protein